MPFHDPYSVRPGDNLSSIAREAGFENPGPVYAYPANQALFRRRSPDVLRPGERLLIPYPRELLQKIAVTSQHLIDDVTATATRLIKEGSADKQALESFLMKVDAANFLANVGVGIGSLAIHGARGGTMSAKEAVRWFADSRVGIAGSLTTSAIPAPTAPRRDFRFYVRHALGPWNPSFWASVYTAIEEGDVNIYLYGADHTSYERAQAIKRQAEQDVGRLRARMAEAHRQLGMHFYNHRI